MRIKTLWFLPILILALALVMGGCTKEGDPVKGNVAPDTRVLSYVVSSKAEVDSAGAPTTNYKVTVFWAGSDIDGTVKSFLYDDGVNKGESLRSQEDFVYDFANAAAEYTLTVQAKDNLETVDPTPAEVIITRNSGGVETMILDGPPHGAEVSPGISYKVGSTSQTGHVKAIECRINDGSWVSTAADANGEAIVEFVGLDAGPTVLSFRGVRDDDLVDESPASISVLVRIGVFMPVLENLSPVVDGGGWFEGVGLTFSWTQTTSHYYGALPAEAYCAIAGADLAPPAEYNLNPDDAMGDGWQEAASFDYSPVAGNHVFYLKVRDTGGGVDTMRIRFSAAAPTFDQGILVVNGVDYGTYGDFGPHITSSAYWGTFSVDFWDLMGSMGSPSFALPASANYVGGGSQLAPDLMAKYSTIVWLGNNYLGDWELFQLTPVYAYLQAGGNVILTSRYLADFVDANLTAYANVAWREYGASIVEYEPVFPGLISFEEFSRTMSATDVWSGGGYLDSTDDGTVTNWNGTSGYTKSDLTTTLLFAHRSDGYDSSSPFAYVRGLGSWAHPNFAFSAADVGNEFPAAGTDGAKGNFVIISGRHYGFSDAAISHNFDFMLKNMCAEQ